MRRGLQSNSPPQSTGQATVIAFALLIGIVLAGTTTVLLLGAGSIADSKQVLNTERAEQTLAEFDSQATVVGAGQARVREVPLQTTERGSYWVNESAGRIIVTVISPNGTQTVLVDQHLGELRYENSGTQVAYQGGGVWKQTDTGSTMVSAPQLHYRGNSITLPIRRVGGDGRVEESVRIRETEPSVREYPTADTGSYLDEASVRLTLTSDYYQAWGEFFEQRTDATPTIHDSNKTVTVNFEPPAPANLFQPSAGIVSAASGETIELDNNACVDTYNSTDGGWNGNTYKCDQSTTKDSIVTRGGIKLNSGQTKLRGNVTAGGTVETAGGQVKGSVLCADGNADCVTKENKVSKDVINTDRTISPPSPVTDRIAQKTQSLNSSSDNDNDAEDDITGTTIDKDAGTEEIGAGQYYLTSLDRDSDVVFDTTDGDIILVIDGKWDLDGAHFTVTGPNDLKIYITDQDTEVVFDNGAKLTVEDGGSRTYNSEQVWVYGTPGFEFDLNSESEFTGVVYAPEGDTGEAGEVEVQSSAIFGAVVAHVEKMDENNKGAYIHYDTSLATTSANQAAEGDQATAPAEYLHVTTSRINVTG